MVAANQHLLHNASQGITKLRLKHDPPHTLLHESTLPFLLYVQARFWGILVYIPSTSLSDALHTTYLMKNTNFYIKLASHQFANYLVNGHSK